MKSQKVSPIIHCLAFFLFLTAIQAYAQQDYKTIFSGPEVINYVVWSSDDKYIFIANGSQIDMVEAKTGTKTASLKGHSDYVSCLSLSSDGKYLASGGWDGKVIIWDVSTPYLAVEKTNLKISSRPVKAVILKAESNSLYTGDCEGKVKVWRLTGGMAQVEKVKSLNCDCVYNIDLDPSGTKLAATSQKKVLVWDLVGDKVIQELSGHGEEVSDVHFTHLGDKIVSCGKDGRVIIWSIKNKLSEYKDHEKGINKIALTYDSKYMVSAGNDGNLIIRDINTDELLNKITSSARLTAVDISHDGRYLVVGGSDHTVKLYNLYENRQIEIARSLPCDLVTTVAFHDENNFNPNNMLDGAEKDGYLTIITENKGPGPAYDVELGISVGNSYVVTKSAESLGTLPSGEKKEVTWPVQVSLDAVDGKAIFSVDTKEKRGQNAKKLQLEIPVVHLDRPQYDMTVEINDGKSGLANGDGNGVPANGETIELIVNLKNVGVGRALGTKVELSAVNPGIRIDKGSFIIDNLQKDKIVQDKLIISIPKDLADQKLNYQIKISDSRGAAFKDFIDSRPIEKKNPTLVYELTLPPNARNGQTAEGTMVVKNIGKLDASNVTVKISTKDNVDIEPLTLISLGQITAQSQKPLPSPITFKIPRNYLGKELQFEIELRQSSFNGLNKTEILPVELSVPKLEIDNQFFDSDDDGKIQQGENVDLELWVKNLGRLDAENVKVALACQVPNVIIGQKEYFFGAVPNMSRSMPERFKVTVPRGVTPGNLYFPVTLTQTDFPISYDTISIEVLPEKEEKVVIKGTESPGPIVSKLISSDVTNKPPKIFVDGPEGTVYSPIQKIDLFISDDKSLRDIYVELNGERILNPQEDPDALSSLEKSKNTIFKKNGLTLDLKPGINKLMVKAYNSDGLFSIETIDINYVETRQAFQMDNPSDVDVNLPQENSFNPNRYGIVIGISKYKKAPPAKYADRDAQAFKEYLIRTLAVPEKNIELLTNDDATKYEFERLFFEDNSWLNENIKGKHGQSEVFVFYAGHGIPVRSSDTTNFEPFLLPYDVDPIRAQSGAVSVNRIYKALSQAGCNSAFVVLDACFSSIGRDNQDLIPGARPVYLVAESPLAFEGISVFSASDKDQISSSYEEKRHGLFTYYFLKGLKGEADLDHNKDITVDEMDQYLKQMIPEVAKQIRRQQDPVLITKDRQKVLVKIK